MTARQYLYYRWGYLMGYLRIPRPINTSCLYEAVVKAYKGGPYHSIEHVKECLSSLDEAEVTVCPEVELALWYHDALYDPHCAENEAVSARFAREQLEPYADRFSLEKVERLILATRHDQEPEDLESRQVLDADLNVFGADPGFFQLYEQWIRQESYWVEETVYRTERTKVLQRFLDRPFVYHTSEFRVLYEERARQNLTWALEQLSK